jgi:DNA invertase Pin-like site-specific DNA recombinase
VRAGMAHARAMGKRIGRPRAEVDVDCVVRLRQQGRSLREIARTLDIPVSRVRRAIDKLRTEEPEAL